MEMTLRWYGSKFDTVTLKQIRQIPGVTGVITTLYDTTPGEVWSRERIRALKEEVAAAGMHIAGIESVNVHDAIKIGSADRDQYIDNYIETLRHLGQEDIHLVCYNFMPVFDWTRTELARVRPDGSTVLAYTQDAVDALDPEKMFASIAGDTNGTIMPGWEPERMARVKELFAMYKEVDDEKENSEGTEKPTVNAEEEAEKARAASYGLSLQDFRAKMIKIAFKYGLSLEKFTYHPANKTVSYTDLTGTVKSINVLTGELVS